MRRGAVLAVAISALAIACSKDRRAPAADEDAATTAPAPATSRAPGVLSREDARTLVEGACLSCHSEEMLAQQRLTHAQWSKVVTKMVGWGANLEPKDVAPLTAWLAATYGPDAGPYEPAPIDVEQAAAEIAPLADGPFTGGDPERGRALYVDRCSGCHGAEARGHIGVALVERPLLYRAADVARIIRRGRGKMTAMTMSDAEIADVLAHLRRLRL